MEIGAVHDIRSERYLTRRYKIDGTRLYWQDNTIKFAARIFNGNSKAAGHHANTARMLYDKHWHGHNMTKTTKLSEDEKTAQATCHLCGTTDSQSHAFRRCQHNNVSAIRRQTQSDLQNLATHF